MSEPLISIVLCCYNGERFIREQVDSLLQQTYRNIEVIVSDDCSTDATARILSEYKSDKRMRIFLHKQNAGQGKNVEFALGQAMGDFIAFADQDDIWLKDKLESMIAGFNGEALVYSDSELIDETGKAVGKRISQLRKMYSGKETTGFVFSNVVWGHAMMIRRELVNAILPIPQSIPHDIWMAYKAATVTGIKYLDLVLTKYRQHAETATRTIAERPESRTQSRRFADFKKQLNWMSVMKENAADAEAPFYTKLHALYAQKETGRYNWQLFLFLLRHRRQLFMFTRKNGLSQLIEIWKQARGERP